MKREGESWLPRLMSFDDAAKYIGVSKRTVESYVAAGDLKTLRLPAIGATDEYLKRTFIEKTELDRLIDRGLRF